MFLVKELILLNGKSVSFKLDSGEDKIIRGSNGTGKSLFFKALSNLVSTKFESFIYQDKNLSEWKPEIYRSKVLYVSQVMPKNIGTVEEYLKQPLTLSIYKDFKSDFPLKAFTEKWELTGKELTHLSMGQRQLLSVLRAVYLNPEVLLLDEPTSHLDQKRTSEVEELLLDWKKKSQGSLLLIVHDNDQAKRLGIKEVYLDDLSAEVT